MKTSSATVVGLCGCSAVGKSTLVANVQQFAKSTAYICCDDYYLPKSDCPTFELSQLPWPSGSTPSIFSERGNHDLNSPAALDWRRLCDDIGSLKSSSDSGATDAILVDGLLLFSSHQGARELLSLCDHTAVIWVDEEDEPTITEIFNRKFRRSNHLGKPSYSERGVTVEEYTAYFYGYVWPRWVEHGSSRVPDSTLRIDARKPIEQQVELLMSTGWFPR